MKVLKVIVHIPDNVSIDSARHYIHTALARWGIPCDPLDPLHAGLNAPQELMTIVKDSSNDRK